MAYQKRRREQLEQESSDYVNTSYVIEDIRLDKCSVKESGRSSVVSLLYDSPLRNYNIRMF